MTIDLRYIVGVPEVASTLTFQAWLHSTVDGSLSSLHCCLCENPENLHCHLDTLVLVPPQIRLHHPRVQREHAYPCACNMSTNTYTVTYIQCMLYIHENKYDAVIFMCIFCYDLNFA